MIGSTVGHYRIVERLGGGGMGVVYKAEDLTLHRTVALKFLPPELTRDESAKRRFLHEARAAAQLDHTNICPVHEVGESDDGQTFIAMTYYEGESLAKRLERGPIPVEEAAKIAIEVARGLATAHQAGIIHRDIKPANVMLTSKGGVKIVDFGVAKLAGVTMTQGGSSPGTLAYMAPEQIRGEPVTPATDVWSLGAVFYEMLTGSRPFRGDYEQAVAYTILNEAPVPLDQSLPNRPPVLDSVIAKALSKDSKTRYQTAEDFIAGLETVTGVRAALAGSPKRATRRLAVAIALFVIVGSAAGIWLVSRGRGPAVGAARQTGSATPGKAPVVALPVRTVAVLPLASFSGEEGEYLAAGMQDALIVELGRIEQLRVISRTSANAFKSTKKSATEIAKALHAEELVEGSVQHAGNRVRVQVKLIGTVPEEKEVWAETFDRDMSDIFALYREVAAAVALHIEPRLSGTMNASLPPSRKVDPEMYKLCLKAKAQLMKGTEEDFKRGIAMLREANEMDPSDPLPYAGIATAYTLLAHSPAGTPEVLGIAKASARKALAIDPDLAEVHASLAIIRQYSDWDWNGLEDDYRRSLALNPTDAELRRHFAWFLMLQKRGEEALVEMRRSCADDPLGGVYYSDTGWLLHIQGRYDEALVETRRGIELEPENTNNLLVHGLVCLKKGMPEEAIEAHRKLMKVDPGTKWPLAYTLVMTGRNAEAQKLIDEMRKKNDADSAFGLVWVYAAAGDEDEAIRWLDLARQKHHIWTPWVGVDPELALLRGDPRFTEILAKVGVPNVEPGYGLPASG